MAEERSTNPFERLLGPKLGRAVERFTLAPVTRLKLLLQTQNYHIRNGKLSAPLSFLGWTSLLMHSNGFTSLYSGALLMLLKVEAALWLGDWINSKRISAAKKTDENKYQNRSQSAISKFIMNILLFGLFYPLDTIVTRVMASHPDSSTISILSDTFSSKDSIISLYNGFGIGMISILAKGALSLVSTSIFSYISRYFVNYPGRVRLGTLKWLFGSVPLIGTYFLDTIMRELMLADRLDLSGLDYAKITIEQHGISSLYGGCLFYLTFSAVQTFTLGFIDVVARFKFPR